MRRLHHAQMRWLLALALAPAFALVAHADFKVAYINASGGSVDYLSSYGITVTNLNDPTGLTLAQLAPYDAILITGNSAFTQPTTIGNVAAAFADSGKGVVLAAFATFTVAGDIVTPAYSPVNLTSTNPLLNTATLGTVLVPSSPILSGVDVSQVGAKYNVGVGLNPGATLVADWAATNQTGARHAVAYTSLDDSSVVFLNLFPSSGAVGVDSGITTSDSQLLVANALKFSAQDRSPPTDVTTPAPPSIVLAVIGAAVVLVVSRCGRARALASLPRAA
jgi:hypothetical protein